MSKKPSRSRRVHWRKLCFELHGWLGLNLGLLLFVVCLSGTFATLSDEIDALIDARHRVAEVPEGDRDFDWTAMYETLRRSFPLGDVQTIYAPGASGRPEVMTASTALAFVVTPDGDTRKVFLDPFTGELRGHTSFFNVERFFRSFHRRFFDGTRGIVIVTLTGFALLLSAISGFSFYRGWWRQMRSLQLGGTTRRRWSDLHKIAGIWGLPFTAVIAVTGIYYFVEVAYQQAGEYGQLLPPPMAQVDAAELADFGPQPALLSANQFVEIAQEAIPGLEARTLRIPRAPSAAVYVDGQAGNVLTRDRADAVHIHPFTGEVLDVRLTRELGVAPFMTDAVDPLHFGYFGGLATQLIWFVLGLLLSFSILSGMYIWVVRSTTAVKKPTRLQRGAPIAVGLTLAYLVVVVFATADGIRVYTPPGRELVSVDRSQVGPYQVGVDCFGRCQSDRPRLAVRFSGTGMPNYQSVEIVGREGVAHRLAGPSRLPTGVTSFPSAEATVVRVTTRDGQVHTGAVSPIGGESSPLPAPEWPDTAPGVWWVVIGFGLLTVGSILGWLWMVWRVARST